MSLARTAIADLTDAALTSDDPETCARLWTDLESIRDDAARASAEVAEHLAKVMSGHNLYRLRVEGLPPIVRYTPKDRKAWRKDDLLGELKRLVPQVDRTVSRSSGELEGDAEVAFRLVQECISLGGGKVTGLRKYDLDPDEFCEVTVAKDRARFES